jgi:hypothetical protein
MMAIKSTGGGRDCAFEFKVTGLRSGLQPPAAESREQRRSGQTDTERGNKKPNIKFPVLSEVMVVVVVVVVVVVNQ